jgi:hypothetical protein
MTKKTWGTLLAAAVFALAGCAGPVAGPTPGRPPASSGSAFVRTIGCATATSPSPTTIDGTPWPANQDALGKLVGRIQPYAMGHFADVFSGMELRGEQNKVRVYRKPSAAFDAWVLHDFAADCVEMVDARFNETELAAMRDRVSDDIEFWRAKGLPINSVAAAIDGSGIEVTTTEVERAKAELAERYGPDLPIKVSYGKPFELAQ